MPLTTGLPASRLVKVSVALTSPAVIAPAINTCLVIGTGTVISVAERMRRYANISEVASDFGTTAQEYLAAATWFAQSPSPDNIEIGRWANVPAAGALIGRPLSAAEQSMTLWRSITTGSFRVALDGAAPTNIGPLNFSGAANLNAVAAIIDTAVTGGTMVWNANQAVFQMTSGTTGPTSSISFLTPPVIGVDISAMLGMTAGSGAIAAPGQATETPLAALAAIDAMYSSQFYGVVCPGAADLDHDDLGLYCEASDPPHYYGLTTAEPKVLIGTDHTDIASVMQSLGLNRTAVQYSTTNPYAIMSYLGRILTTNWTGQNTAITLMYKHEPGVAPENVSSGQADTIQGKNCNVYVPYANGATLIQYGVSSSGEYTDTIIGADALALDLQTSLFNVLYTSPTKIPQTDPGMSLLVTEATRTCAGYVANGYLSSGVWNAPGFGTLKQGDPISLGFYIYAPSMLLQTAADRAARKAPIIQIAAKTAGAIHSAEVVVFVNQ
jgi:hypothetical protein